MASRTNSSGHGRWGSYVISASANVARLHYEDYETKNTPRKLQDTQFTGFPSAILWNRIVR